MVTRYLILAFIASLLALACPPAARAATADLRLGGEIGVGTLAPPGVARRWGQLAAMHAALGITDRLGVQVLFDRKHFTGSFGAYRVETLGLAMIYNIDVGRVTPFVELGAARVLVRWASPSTARYASTVASMGAGFDVFVTRRLLIGSVVRYYALFDSALFDRPGYTTLHARLSVLLPLWKPERMRTY